MNHFHPDRHPTHVAARIGFGRRLLWATLVTCLWLLPARGAEEEKEPGFWGKLFTSETLSGDWGGGRSFLSGHGVEFEFLYTADVLSNVGGGIRRQTEFLGNLDLMLSIEFEPLLGWPGAKLFIYGLGNHGGNPTSNTGDLQGVDNIEAYDTWKLYEAWFQQKFLDDKIAILIGMYDLNSELEVIPAAGLFLNSSFGIGADFGLSGKNGPSIFPTASLGARLEVLPGNSTYIRLVVLDGVPGDPDNPRGNQFAFAKDDGLLLAAEIGLVNNPKNEIDFTHAASHQSEPRPTPDEDPRKETFGKYAIGVWGYTGPLEDLDAVDSGGFPTTHKGTYGLYLFIEQRVFYEELRPSQGLSLFFRFGIADTRVNPVDGFVGGGAVYRGLFPGRARDRLGFGVAAAHLGDAFRRSRYDIGETGDAWEIALELTYSIRLTPWLSLQPDLQYVLNPSGIPGASNAWVAGSRFTLAI